MANPTVNLTAQQPRFARPLLSLRPVVSGGRLPSH